MPSKRLIVLFDGTDNTPEDRTNVWRTRELIADADANGIRQETFYIQGVGTEIGSLLSGSIFGAGVSRKICEGYSWLVNNYEDGAEIYVFGFSRGAFTARSLVQLIANCGLTRKEALARWSVDDAFKRYEKISMQDTEKLRPIWRLRYWQKTIDQGKPDTAIPRGWRPDETEARLLDDQQVRVVRVRMAGLWDTVGAIGKDALANKDALRAKSAAHNVRPTKAQEYGYHALAIDEHRPMFEATLWRSFVKNGDEAEAAEGYAKFYEQRWFIGAHSDVGGGYDDTKGLPDISLRWMIEKASALGLAFTHSVEPPPGVWHAKIHDSFESFAGGVLTIWDKVLPGDQRNYRDLGRDSKPFTTARGDTGKLCSINETIDESALLRLIEDKTYRPPGLIKYLKSKQDSDPQFLKRLLSPLIPPADLNAGVIPDIRVQRTKRIQANAYWNETGVFLREGCTYRARVVPGLGEPLMDATYKARGIEGEDWDSHAHHLAAALHGKRKDDAKWFALIGTLDEERAWVIRDGAEFKAPVSGQLVCYFNDVQIKWFYGNNSGWVVLDVELLKTNE